ncbi:Prenylcysteine lyase-domain-containing protein [Globomyces pollinis-pini]|nr:Prenylcysteine lyase-domain-containing protein [Globomyces pollinis-pini]
MHWTFLFTLQSSVFANHQQVVDNEVIPRVGIIGSGAAGSSVAYFLKKQYPNVNIEIFERSNRIGGRAYAIPLNLTTCSPQCENKFINVEMGGSIFAKSNQHMMNSIIEFKLELNQPEQMDQESQFGIWNGTLWNFYEKQSRLGKWFNSLKLLWKYGFLNGPIQAGKISKEIATKFNQIYSFLDDRLTWTNSNDMINHLGLEDQVTQTCKHYMLSKGINEQFIDDMLGGITRNIYLTDVDMIHSFGCQIGMFASVDEVYSVVGGNHKVFENMLKDSTISLDTTVISITKQHSSYLVEVESDGSKKSIEFDHVVLAAPLTDSKIEFVGFDSSQFPIHPVTYVKLYGNSFHTLIPVTLVYGQLDPTYFALSKVSEIPMNILTPKGASPFNCMAIKAKLNATHTLVKFFSTAPLTDSDLDSIHVSRIQTWTHSWDLPGSYPLLTPLPVNEWELSNYLDGLWYANSFERWVSTMETETIAGRNIAIRLAESFSSKTI